jgi:hypothetical protein
MNMNTIRARIAKLSDAELEAILEAAWIGAASCEVENMAGEDITQDALDVVSALLDRRL